MADPKNLLEALAEPFSLDEVEFKPQAVSGNRALAICYIDARVVMDRLDRVLGIGGWQTTYRELEHGVVCRLRVRVDENWIEHEDVGSYSDQPDKGDRLKAAFSDALKRAAVHVGIGRYLYSLPSSWVDYDPQKKTFLKTPKLPDWAMPTNGKATASKPQPAKPAPQPAQPAPQPAQPSADALPGGMTQKQHDDMLAAYRDVGGDPAKLCGKYKVGTTEEIPVGSLDAILKQIAKRKREDAAAAAVK